ncbi:Gfo/Idh/MocA family oxidoreductase [Candidatus Poribacteria bacterium]|nr:Gfo/Idh/MocA family oxidoreductase [Candidatus Poribacteria bacterium]
MDRVRAAVVGGGSLANAVHYPSLSEMEDVEIVAIAELNPARLNATADKYGVAGRFTDYRQMIAETEPDAVYILMPPYHLFDITIHALNAGKHVFIEKPPGVTTYQTTAFARLAEQKGVKTMCGFNRRHIPLLKWAKDEVTASGEIVQCVATFYKYHTGGRYYDGAIDILTCDAVHAVDTLRWMGGDVTKVTSLVRRYHADFDNAFNALVEFESGATGVLLTNWMTGARMHAFELHAPGASAYVDGDREARLFVQNGPAQVRTTQDAAGSASQHRYYGFLDESRHFIDCIREDRLPTSHFGDAVKTMELVDRIYANNVA